MPHPTLPAYYLSATLAIAGTVGYHTFVKKIPPTIDPIVSLIGIYIGVLLIGLIMLPFIYSGERIAESVRQLGWVQIGIAISIVMIELGFILMYRNGWELSVGNALTSAVINLVLMAIGMAILREKLSMVNVSGILLCIAGVVMTGIRG
jgi:drug/metabolite transporter (DMT)-like permease